MACIATIMSGGVSFAKEWPCRVEFAGQVVVEESWIAPGNRVIRPVPGVKIAIGKSEVARTDRDGRFAGSAEVPCNDHEVRPVAVLDSADAQSWSNIFKIREIKLGPVAVVQGKADLGSRTFSGTDRETIALIQFLVARETPRGEFAGQTAYAVIHEYIHQWWFRELFVPNNLSFLPSPKLTLQFGCHEFLEMEEMAFFEEFAMTETEFLIPRVFPGAPRYEMEGKIDPMPFSKFGIVREFLFDKEVKPTVTEKNLREWIESDSEDWHRKLNQNKLYVRSLMRILLMNDWFKYDFDGCRDPSRCGIVDRSNLVDAAKAGSEAFSGDAVLRAEPVPCAAELLNPLFKPEELFGALLDWKASYENGKVPTRERSIDGFIDFLGASPKYFPRYGRYVPFLKTAVNPSAIGADAPICM